MIKAGLLRWGWVILLELRLKDSSLNPTVGPQVPLEPGVFSS